jgi:XTP/dITP diphosphohydrolase
MHGKEEKLKAFERALEVMDRLREECPWNHAQTNESLRPLTMEEVYELSDAVLDGSPSELRKELGSIPILFTFRTAGEGGEKDIRPGKDRSEGSGLGIEADSREFLTRDE